jgi:integrase
LLDDAIEIRDYLTDNFSLNTVKRIITNISACCDWAIDSKLIENNPFRGMSKKIKIFKSDKEEMDINPFTREERDAIIKAFQNSKYYSYYTLYVKFLFYTGCRPSEAIALQWKHITDKFIFFEQALVTNGKKLIIKEGLKTQVKRKFPLNSQVNQILESIKPEVIKPNEFIFKSNEGNFIDTGNFLNRAWKGYQNRHGTIVEGIVTQLVQEGKVSEYRKPYQTRHTFITLCLEADIDAKDIARWVGNSPEIIYKHYAGNKRDLQVP